MTKVTIRYNSDYDEYRVPGPDRREASAYYTSDASDAMKTARLMYGSNVLIVVRKMRAK